MLICLELNELNFKDVEYYVSKGGLVNFKRLLSSKIIQTTSEKSYPYLEPWIQWPTVYSGKSFNEHGVYRLGDVIETSYEQIWECLESRGYEVEAISPMNARNCLKRSSLFIPDPWTETEVTAPSKIRSLYEFIKASVNSNSTSTIKLRLAISSIPSLLTIATPGFFKKFIILLVKSIKNKKVIRPLILDLILFQLLIYRTNKNTRIDYISLFLNAGAHIQHHFYFSSALNRTNLKNPEWYYLSKSLDPVYEVYMLYDDFIGQLLDSQKKFVVITGLSQKPNDKIMHQYRAINFESIITDLGLPKGGYRVSYRMSRDFVVYPDSVKLKKMLIEQLSSLRVLGEKLFSVDDRGASVFVMVKYNGVPESLTRVNLGNSLYNMADYFEHVSVENQIHSSIGYVADPYDLIDTNNLDIVELQSLREKIIKAVSA